jgi:peroxiredoxin
VIEEYGDITDDSGSFGDAASIERAISVGRMAPEIEGEDLDGKKFKLSDFRGKVVVLDFWSHEGCAVCRAGYPEVRSLIKRLEGKPVVWLGISNCDTREALRKVRETGEVTWRFWVDGDPSEGEGKIFKNWNIRAFPTIFVLDRDGIIRHQGFWMSLMPLLEYAVEQRLAEQEAIAKP